MAKIIITERQMDLIVKNLLSEAVGVPEHIIESAEELYEIITNQLKRLSDYGTKQDFTVGGLDLKISDYVINSMELQVEIHEPEDYDGPVVIASAGVANQFKFDKKILMKVHREDNEIELHLNFVAEEDEWDAEDIYNCFTGDKIEMVSIIAHEMKHKFDKQKKKTDLIGRDADYQAYASQRLNFGIPVINEFMRYSYFIQGAENLVRPTEMATRMKLKGITKDQFREFFENDKTFQELKSIRDFSYKHFITKLYEQMDSIDALLEHVGADYQNMTEEEKIKEVLTLVYMNLAHAKKDHFDRMTSDGNSMLADLRRMLNLPVEPSENEEEFDKVRNNFLNHVIKYQKREDEFFIDECERFNYEATKLIKRLVKIYSLIPDEKEQTNESIINWDLHQQIMEKKYGRRKIKTKYDF
jgi:uncharacterized protein YgfB (UPF0149 family)